MKTIEKISFEEIEGAKFKVRIIEAASDRKAAFTHYAHNSSNGAAQFFKEGALDYVKQFLEKKHPEEKITKTIVNNALQYAITDFLKRDVPFPPPENPKFKFIDLFAGIGGIRLAYQNLGGKCVFTSEWNDYSKKTYEANFGEVPFGDITKIKEDEIPDHDVLLAGFPCQPFSIAGVSKKNALGRKHGFLDETQGTLFFDIARILKHKKPKAFMLENVKNLISHDKKHTFRVIVETLKELGYTVYFKVLDGKHFVPQHRERIIIVGFNNDVFKGKEAFEFPQMPEPKVKFKDILDSKPLDKYTLTDHLWKYLQAYADKHKAKGNGFGFGLTDLNGISRTMSARYYKDGAEILIPQKGKNPRRLTPREASRLQGFPDDFLIPVSDTQAYKQFGNSVTVPLMQAVGKQVVKVLLKANGKHINQSHSVSAAV